MSVTVHYKFLVSIGPVDVSFGCSWYYFVVMLLHKDIPLCSALHAFFFRLVIAQGQVFVFCNLWFPSLIINDYYTRMSVFCIIWFYSFVILRKGISLCSALHDYLVALLHKGVSFFSAFHYFLVSLLHQRTYSVAVGYTTILFHCTSGLDCVLYVSWYCSVSIIPVGISLLLCIMTSFSWSINQWTSQVAAHHKCSPIVL